MVALLRGVGILVLTLHSVLGWYIAAAIHTFPQPEPLGTTGQNLEDPDIDSPDYGRGQIEGPPPNPPPGGPTLFPGFAGGGQGTEDNAGNDGQTDVGQDDLYGAQQEAAKTRNYENQLPVQHHPTPGVYPRRAQNLGTVIQFAMVPARTAPTRRQQISAELTVEETGPSLNHYIQTTNRELGDRLDYYDQMWVHDNMEPGERNPTQPLATEPSGYESFAPNDSPGQQTGSTAPPFEPSEYR
ncbi:unnamed protein product, partial [Mesorhabditis spiculigera]